VCTPSLQNPRHRYCTETFTVSPSTTTKYTPDFRFWFAIFLPEIVTTNVGASPLLKILLVISRNSPIFVVK
jgi:hypothetical protein